MELVVRQGILFVVSIVLARLLSPEDFGIIAIVSFFTSLTVAIVQSGLATALIQRQDTTQEEESAAFWCTLVGSLTFAVVLVALGPFMARFYSYPVLQPLMIVAAVLVLLTAAGATHAAILTRELRFDLLTKAGVFASLIGGAAGIAAALAGAGLWALAIQLAALALVNSAALWWFSEWRPSPVPHLASARRLFSFGRWVSFGNFLDAVYTQGFALLIGKLHGVPDVGLYNRAAATQALPSNMISSMISRVALPLFSSRDDPAALRRGLQLAIGFAMLLNLPAMVGVAILSHEIIDVLFGNKWVQAAPILRLLAIAGAIYPIHALNVQLTLALGRTSTFIRLELIKKIAGVGTILIGSLFGVLGLAASQIVYSCIALVLNTAPQNRTIGYGTLQQARDLGGLFVVSSVMGITILFLKSRIDLPSLPTLLICIAAGLAAFLASALALRLAILREALVMIADTRAGRRMPLAVGARARSNDPPSFGPSL